MMLWQTMSPDERFDAVAIGLNWGASATELARTYDAPLEEIDELIAEFRHDHKAVAQ